MSDKEEADNSNSCTETGESDYSLSDHRTTFSHSCLSSSMAHLQKKAIQAKNGDNNESVVQKSLNLKHLEAYYSLCMYDHHTAFKPGQSAAFTELSTVALVLK